MNRNVSKRGQRSRPALEGPAVALRATGGSSNEPILSGRKRRGWGRKDTRFWIQTGERRERENSVVDDPRTSSEILAGSRDRDAGQTEKVLRNTRLFSLGGPADERRKYVWDDSYLF